MIPRAALEQLVGVERAERWAPAVGVAGVDAALTSPRRQAHFLAQVLHETAGFRAVVENLNYTAAGLAATWPGRFDAARAAELAGRPEAIAAAVYDGRLGNRMPGDGWKYRGRGLIMLTGRGNYAAAAEALGAPELLEDPELAAEPSIAAEVAAWYWRSRGINAAADADDLERVTRLVNGGRVGIEERRAWLALAKRALATAQPPEAPAPAPNPERVGATHRALVLHDLHQDDVRAVVLAWFDNRRSIPLPGTWAVSVTADPTGSTTKVDARRERTPA